MRQEEATNITARCFHGEPASCSHDCPFFFDIRTFLARAKDGKWGLAYKLYRNATVFPAIVSRLCEAPCRAECQRGPGNTKGDGSFNTKGDGSFCVFVGDDPVDIRAVEAAAVRYAKDRKPVTYRIPPRDQRVAVVGAGLAGLSTALNLAQKAWPVTVYERGDKPLWSWVDHTGYETFNEEIELQFSPVEARFVYGADISGPDDPAIAGFACVIDATDNAGVGPVEAIANGIELSKTVEALLQTGDLPAGTWISTKGLGGGSYGSKGSKGLGGGSYGSNGLGGGSYDAAAHLPHPEKHYPGHTGERHIPIVIAAEPESGYTREEASAEASRCMGCDCRACMDACEMLGRYNKRPQKIAVEAYADTISAPPFSSCTLTRETYSCNLCGYCRSVCPVGVDLEKLFHIARTGRAETGKHPKAFHDFWLRDFEWHRTDGAYFSPSIIAGEAGRSTAAAAGEAGRSTAATAGEAGQLRHPILFFPGCKLGARSPSQVEGAAAFLKEEYGAGVLLDCCGAPAYWAGEDATFKKQIESLRNKWEEAGKPVFIFACAYCMRLFSEFLPEIEKVSLYELLATATRQRNLPLLSSRQRNRHLLSENGQAAGHTAGHTAAVFDPCTAGGFPDMEQAVRELAAGAGIATTELPEKNRCCGFGGHMRTANPDLYDTVTSHRSASGETPYIVYCANCADTFELQGKEHAHILDLVFEAGPPFGNLSLQQRRANASRAKSALMELFEGRPFEPGRRPWDDIELLIEPSLVADMDRRLILADDLKEAIYEAERTGVVFTLPGGAPDGGDLYQSRLIRDVVTIWVQWFAASPVQPRGDNAISQPCHTTELVYTVIDAWCHRMRFADAE